MKSDRFESLHKYLGTISVAFLSQMTFVRNSHSSDPMRSCTGESLPSAELGWGSVSEAVQRPMDSEEEVSCLHLGVHLKLIPFCASLAVEGHD